MTLYKNTIQLSLALFFFMGIGALTPRETAAQNELSISIEVGEQAQVDYDGYDSFSVGDRGVVDVRAVSRTKQLIIVGKRPGRSSVLLISDSGKSKTYTISVKKRKLRGESAQVDAAENIRLDLYFVQVSDSYSHNIGLAWPTSFPSANGSGVNGNVTMSFPADGPSTTSGSFAVAVQQVLPRLDLAQASGWAKIYRQVALVTANGTNASFNAGGELNVSVAAGLTGTLQRVQYGTELNCLPTYDAQTGRLELRVRASVADLTDDRGTGVPGRTTAEVESVVNLSLGESMVLGGFIAQSQTRSQGGLAGLSQIPILGLLFGTNSSFAEESEALMFIVPSVIEPVPLVKRNRIQEALNIFEEFSGGREDAKVLEQPRILR